MESRARQNPNVGGVGGSSGSITTVGANVFAIHFDGEYLAFLYNPGILNFAISGLGQGVSTILAFNCAGCEGPPFGPGETPIPGAAFLMGSVLAGGAGFGFWKRRRKNRIAA
jgi:LPXTG-motif cell wall-anchored protein